MWDRAIVFAWLQAIDLLGWSFRNSSKIKQGRGDSLINFSWGQTYATRHMTCLGSAANLSVKEICLAAAWLTDEKQMYIFEVWLLFLPWRKFVKTHIQQFNNLLVWPWQWRNYPWHHPFSVWCCRQIILLLTSAYIRLNLTQPHWNYVFYYLADIKPVCWLKPAKVENYEWAGNLTAQSRR